MSWNIPLIKASDKDELLSAFRAHDAREHIPNEIAKLVERAIAQIPKIGGDHATGYNLMTAGVIVPADSDTEVGTSVITITVSNNFVAAGD